MSYIQNHPTNFNWTPDVARSIARVQKQFPWKTYANTYWWHPPYDPPVITTRYDALSVDYWGGGVKNGRYVGYRGKDINLTVDADKVFDAIWNDPYLPNIHWIIWNGWMWVRGVGWQRAPWGPADSDAGHFKHIHCTYHRT